VLEEEARTEVFILEKSHSNEFVGVFILEKSHSNEFVGPLAFQM